jgi:hypothetical protein
MFGTPSRVLALLVAMGLIVRLSYLLSNQYPYTDSGLAADSAEIARQIDDHGRWFTANLPALNQLINLQARRGELIDPADVSFRVADAHPNMQPDVLEPIGESILLAGLWKLTGSEHWLWWQLFTIVIDASMVLVVYAIGMHLFARRRTALIGAGLYAVFPPISWLTTIPHMDIWAVDFTLVIVALLLRARACASANGSGASHPGVRRPTPWLLATGVAIGVGSYFRPGLLLLAPLVGLASVSRARWREAARLAAIPTLVAILLIVPWTIRNVEVFHRFIPLRSGVGQNLWEGLGELHNDFGAVLSDAATERQVSAVRPKLVYGTPAYDELLQSWARHAIEDNPGFYVKLGAWRAVKATLLLRNTDWVGSVPSLSQGSAGVFDYAIGHPGDLFALALEPLLFLISVLVAFSTRRRLGRSHLLLVAVIAATLLPYLFLHFEPRYVLPASFAYLLWIALGVDLLMERRVEHRAVATSAHPGSDLGVGVG